MKIVESIETVKIPFIKRLFDIVGSLLLFLILLPFVVILLLWIVVEQLIVPSSRTKLFYHEPRVSGGKIFKLCKFRIFKRGIIENEQKIRQCVHTKPLEKDKKKLTYYGRFLKQVYMDEFPQLWNVLKGDMTLVGPRPTNVENSKRMKEEGDYTKERILCGITGPFQAEKGKGLNQRELDEKYIKFIDTNNGFLVIINDLKIIWKTIRTVIEAKGK